MKHIKHWLATMAVLLCSITASAEDFAVGGIYYNITSSTDLTVEVTFGGSSFDSYANEYSGKVTIPTTVTREGAIYSVTSIGNQAFCGCSSLTNITLPESVTSIGEFVFDGCRGLTSIEIPNSVTSIGKYAFSNCSGLTRIVIPNSVITILNGAFSGCSGLTSVVIGNSVRSIGEFAFSRCSGLTSVTIPNSVTSIENFTFNNCTRLKELCIEDGKEILNLGYKTYMMTGGKGLFYDCPLEILYLGRNLSYRANSFSPFNNIKTLVSVTIGNSVTSIGDYAFSGCSGLTSVEFGNSIKTIGSDAFKDCSGLTNIEIPNSVTSIGEEAFRSCSKLNNAYFQSNPSIGSYAFPENTMKKLNLADNNSVDFNIANANNFANIIYHRELASGKYGTIMLPFSPDAESLENFAFYSLTSAENDMLIFDEVEAPQANTPYLFSLREGKSAIQITGGETTISSEITNPEEVNGWQMIGSFTNQTIATSEDVDNYYYAYTSADNQLHKVTKTLNVKPYRAYFVTNTTNPAQLAVRTRNGETTLIDAAEVEDFATGTYYDLSGRRVENPTKGLYIVNGKKVIL